MTKSLQEIKNQIKVITEGINDKEDYIYVVKCSEELTDYTSIIGYYESLEEAQKAAKEDLAANNNREDVLHYYIDRYVYKDYGEIWQSEKDFH